MLLLISQQVDQNSKNSSLNFISAVSHPYQTSFPTTTS
jgi:hypothetical protein